MQKIRLFHLLLMEICLIKKSCNLIWLRFWPISHKQKFSQKWDLCRNTANNINFHYGSNSVKINKFSNESKRSCFWPFWVHFPKFPICHAQLPVSSNMPKFKYPDRQKDRWKDRQTLFYRAIPTTAGGPKSCCDYYCSWNIRTITTTFEKCTESLGIEMFRNQHC